MYNFCAMVFLYPKALTIVLTIMNNTYYETDPEITKSKSVVTTISISKVHVEQ